MKTIDKELFKTNETVRTEEGNWEIKCGYLDTSDGKEVIAWQVGTIDEAGEFEPMYTAPNFEAIVSWMECNHFNVQGKPDCGPDEYTMTQSESEGE